MAERASLEETLRQAWLQTQRSKHNSVPVLAGSHASTSNLDWEQQEMREQDQAAKAPSPQSVLPLPSPGFSPRTMWFCEPDADGDCLESLSPSSCSCPADQQEGQDPTLTYLKRLLCDECNGRQKGMRVDPMAYGVASDVEPSVDAGLELLDDAPTADVENWMASVFSSPTRGVSHEQGCPDVFSCQQFGQGFPRSRRQRQDGFVGEDGSAFSEPALNREQVCSMLLECGQAVAAADVHAANQLVAKIRQLASPYGSHLQRLAHYFVEALVAKLCGTGAEMCAALWRRGPTSLDILRALEKLRVRQPFQYLGYFYANDSILEAFQGAERVHIIDYGIRYGLQWPSFMAALPCRPGGLPQLLRMTGIDFPQQGSSPNQKVTKTGQRLARLAAELGISFEYKAVVDRWENVLPSSLDLRRDEVLAVTTMIRLRHLLDDSMMPSNPRQLVLERIRSMRPKLLVTGVLHGDGNIPFFMARLCEALYRYETYFDFMDATLAPDDSDRMCLETLMSRSILGTVACEGMDRIERPELFAQWQARIVKAGFRKLPLSERRFNSMCETLRRYHHHFCIAQDDGWCLLGWKQKVVLAFATWQPQGSG